MKQLYTLILGITLMSGLTIGSTSVYAQVSERGVFSNIERSISLYPVPANSYVHVRLNGSLKNDADKVEVYSLIGRKIAEQGIRHNDSEIIFSNLNEWAAGVYMVVAKDKGGRILESSKLVINH